MAGLAIPAGGALAAIESLRPRWLETEFRHGVIAFGGGVLLSAVALVLVPDGAEPLATVPALALFLAGGAAFMLLDRALNRAGGSASQLVAMLADFIPEAVALGAAFASDASAGLLLAILITLQNLPEGFNAFRELRASTKHPARTILIWFTAAALLGPACGLIGHLALADNEPLVGAIMLVAAGGILYLTFEDIAPQARLENRYAPPLGAVLGFAAGLAGHLALTS